MGMQKIFRTDKNSPSLAIEAPAKVNLHLAVKNRRSDGFHNLESIFLALEFGDTLFFEQVPADNFLEIVMKGENSANLALPQEKNIIFRAVSLFRNRTGYNQGLRIRVEKRIPLGGGLGGGSSDAVSTLLALNNLACGLLNQETLAEMAASLGSDLPFFLCETGAAWVSGRGEAIKPIESPKNLFFVLVNPGFPSNTAAAFALLDEFRAGSRENHAESADKEEFLLNSLANEPRKWPFRNDFLPVFMAKAENSASNNGKIYRDIIAQLGELEAEFAGLTGTGSTCFGVFTNREKAEKAHKSLLKIWNLTNLTFPLAFEAKQY